MVTKNHSLELHAESWKKRPVEIPADEWNVWKLLQQTMQRMPLTRVVKVGILHGKLHVECVPIHVTIGT